MALTSYYLLLVATSSTWHRVMSTIEAKDLADAEHRAALALRALRRTDPRGHLWNRWVIQVPRARAGLPETVAFGGPDGVEFSVRFNRNRAPDGRRL